MTNFDVELLDLENKPLKNSEDQVVTLGLMAITALMASPADKNPSGKEKFDRFLLATKCKGEVELPLEDLALIKKLIGEIGTPLVVGRAWQLLDAAETK